jgi:DNA-binding IclR family transcriptional regulator
VERALDTLELLAAAGPGGRTLTELAEQIAVSKSSAFALLQSPLISLTMPVLQSVTDATGLTTRLLTPDGAYAIITARIDAPGTVQFASYLGKEEDSEGVFCVGAAVYDRSGGTSSASRSGRRPTRSILDVNPETPETAP